MAAGEPLSFLRAPGGVLERRGRGSLSDGRDQCLFPQHLSAGLPARKAVVAVARAQRHCHRRVGRRPRAGGPPFV